MYTDGDHEQQAHASDGVGIHAFRANVRQLWLQPERPEARLSCE